MSIILNAEIEDRIRTQVEIGRFQSPSQMVEKGLDLLDRESQLKPCEVQSLQKASEPLRGWEMVVALGKAVPSEAWDSVPTDMSKNVDHYLYGSPKVSS